MRKLLSLSSVTKEKEKEKEKEGAMTMTMKMKKGPWTAEEDELLSNCIKRDGEGRWRTLPKRAGLQRCGKSCRLRWMNYLRPSVKRGHISPDEEDLILRLHRLLGNRWSLIAGRIPGRTDNDIKNYWNTHLSKKLLRQGIDPRTHKPLLSPSHTPPTTTITTAAAAAALNQIQDDEVIANTNTNTNTTNNYDAFILSTNDLIIHHDTTTTTTPYPPPPPPPASHSPTFNHCPNSFNYYDPQNQNQVDDDDDDDDVFSSFLNSLLNDDIHIP